MGEKCVMFMIIVVGLCSIFGGSLSYFTNGHSLNSLISIISGVVVVFCTIGFVVITNCLKPPETSSTSSRRAPLPQEDLPPKYRLTWRKEFIQMSPENLRADIEKAIDQKLEGGTRHGPIPIVWTSDVEVGVFGSSLSSLSAVPSSLSSSSGPSDQRDTVIYPAVHGSPSTGRPVSPSSPSGTARSIIMNLDPDEGLPSYEEIQRW